MPELSAEQIAIIEAPLEPMAIVACAGSGKTRTAVHRLIEVRRRLDLHKGRVALLSFSNVAVDTFRRSYQLLAQNLPSSAGRDRVEIDTLDGFITSNVLKPHAHRTMGATQTAFLATGSEQFLKGFTFKAGTYPLGIEMMQVGMRDGEINFYYVNNDRTVDLSPPYAAGIVHKLGRTGAYTHNLGRYWCHRTLQQQPNVLRALARRYPHILIDESQDIGTLHQAILEQLISAGVQLSLIGDPHQGIYEFAGANGKFLECYGQRESVKKFQLTRNYRSIPSILTLANQLSNRNDDPNREAPDNPHGAFFIGYKNTEHEQLIAAFKVAVATANLQLEQSAVVCRGRKQADKLAGNDSPVGQGTVKGFAQAAILRDKKQDFLGAFKSVATCIAGLLANAPQNLVASITQAERYPEAKSLRREIWNFTRNPDIGLPAATLTADTEWHPQLLQRTKALLAVLEQKFDLVAANNLGNKLSKKDLPNTPLIISPDLAAESNSHIRVDTVHQVKGESLDAVLYIATKDHVLALLAGVNSEVGRIGYVAITRARNLFWLAVPANALAELRPALCAKGFQEVGNTTEKKQQQNPLCYRIQ